jgi:hypothetical protein
MLVAHLRDRQFRPFQHFRLIKLPLTAAISNIYVCPRFGTSFALERNATLRINCEAVMWKITTRGFTLQGVLLLAAMNLVASSDTVPNHEKRTSQKSQGDQACEGSTR